MGLKGFVIKMVEPQATIQVTQQAIIKTIMVGVAAKQVEFTNL